MGGGDWTIPGSPIIKYESGEVIGWETTKHIKLEGETSVNTEFKPFNGSDWEMRLIAYFPQKDYVRQATLLNAMDESSTSYNGFCIRKPTSPVTTNIYYGNNKIVIANTENVDVVIKKVGTTLTVEHENTTSTISANYTIKNLTITLGSSINGSGNPYRYSTGIIKYFKIRKI